jgi:hypothetical protein
MFIGTTTTLCMKRNHTVVVSARFEYLWQVTGRFSTNDRIDAPQFSEKEAY